MRFRHFPYPGVILAAAVALAVSGVRAQHAVRRPVDGRPDALIDLRSVDGAGLARGEWRYSSAVVRHVSFRAAGADLKPSGARITTNDIWPKAGAITFDDSKWTVVPPEQLESRRGTGKLSFGWYRIKLTIPERVAEFTTRGSTAVFELVLDDYAEVWVNGQLPRVFGQSGGALIKGYNAPNRIVLTTDARPGDTFQLAILGVNGPLADPPPNFIWIRSAALAFFKPGALDGAVLTPPIIRADPALDAIVPRDAKLEKLADGFLFTEGPVWVPEGYLLFSDPNSNTIYRWSDDDGVSVFRTQSGYSGTDIARYGQPGSNGLALDRDGRLTIDEHGNRRVTRIEKNGRVTVLANQFDGKRLNSPNDLVYRSDGSLYFTDPPFGLPKFFDDPARELSFSGVYRWSDGRVQLLATDLAGPNGLAFSPDERYLYVGNWDERRKVVMRYEVQADGTLAGARVFFDMTNAPGEDAVDGLKVDRQGNVYVSGPGGLWILSADGRHLGTIGGPEHPHNLAWGGSDGRTLYLTAEHGLYRIRLSIPGVRPFDTSH